MRVPCALVMAALLLSLSGTAAAEARLLEFEVMWDELRAERSWDGALQEGAARPFSLNVSQDNLTRVEFLLTWVETGDDFRVSGDDLFRLTVKDPEGNPVQGVAEGRSGLLVVEADRLNPLPPGLQVKAESREQAQELLEPYRGTNGMGRWTAEVRLVDTGNPSGGPAMDKSNTFVLTVVLHYYDVTIYRVVSLAPPQNSLLHSVSGEDAPWAWATLGLTAAATLLGGLLVADRLGWQLPFRRGGAP